MSSFDPTGVALKNGRFFGFPYSVKESDIVVVQAPWDVTTSYRDGTHAGPEAMLNASGQVDLFNPHVDKIWEMKLGTLPVDRKHLALNKKYRAKARQLIDFLEEGGEVKRGSPQAKLLDEVNKQGELFHKELESIVSKQLAAKKRVITVGGDHSCSLGPVRALAKHEDKPFSLLHIDAHADLRVAYEGFTHSHASIIYNLLDIEQVDTITQVGIRDYSRDEEKLIRTNKKLKTFFDQELKAQTYSGISWKKQCEKIISTLGDRVYITFDIDGLDARYCPNTGTPVPGGLEFNEVMSLFYDVVKSGRKIIGADLLEVSPGPVGEEASGEWDANVGARVLFHLCSLVYLSL